MTTLDVTADDISCGHCKATIEGDLTQAPGVRSVEVDVDAKAVRVVYDDSETTPDAIRAKLTDIGYPAA